MNFKHWFKESVVYHGSKSPIEKWDSSNQVSGYYPGFYAWSDPEKAMNHGQHVYKLDIEDSKFYDLKDPDELKQQARKNGFPSTSGSGYQDVEFLKSLGYKGIKRGSEYIIFNPEEWSDKPRM